MIITNSKLKGRYEVGEVLGSGASGVARLARDTLLNRQVVVKLPREVDGATFEREINALARVNHHHVVHVYDHGWTSDGKPFFVMEYVKGQSLEDAIGGRGMELKRAAHIVSQLGTALTAVHREGVIHRDIKPENVMLHTSGGDESAVIIDFGVATVEDTQEKPRERDTWAGTPRYMAPEQLRSRPVPASDVWALGVVAYEMVTGRKPFSPADALALKDAPRAFTKPKSLRHELPQAAQDVILKALSYDPDSRYTHAHEMGDAFLRAVLAGEASTPPDGESLKELLRRCLELFEPLEEFRRPDVLRAYLINKGPEAGARCVKHGEEVDFERLLFCLSRSGRDYPGQLLIDVLASLASHYKGDWQGQKCEALRAGLKRVLEPSDARGE
jgi:serine/threonine-protein kinase